MQYASGAVFQRCEKIKKMKENTTIELQKKSTEKNAVYIILLRLRASVRFKLVQWLHSTARTALRCAAREAPGCLEHDVQAMRECVIAGRAF